MFNPLDLLNIGSTLIDRLVPDKSAAAQAKADLLKMQAQGELDTIAGQLKTNQIEAASESVFVAGWRPFVGWACGAAFVYTFILQPIAEFVLIACGHSKLQFPTLDTATWLPVLIAMLGMGALRSYDKQQGTGNGH